MAKLAKRAIQADQSNSQSRRAKAAGEIEEAEASEREARWHHHAAVTVHQYGNRQARSATIVNGEAIPAEPGYLKDTLTDPDLAAIESSLTRVRLLEMNEVVALGVDVSNTLRATNTAEKLIAHEIAVAHKVAMEQVKRAKFECDPAMEMKRLQISARMMAMAQQGVLTIQKLKTGGTQNVVVQHVRVEAGGQAVVGAVQSGNGV